MVLVYPKTAFDKEQLKQLLHDWPQESYVVLEKQQEHVRLRGLSSYLQEKRSQDVSQLLERSQ